MSLISKKLRVFMSVVNNGSIKKAALELSLTSSPISRMINELESFLDVELFERSGKNLVLTESGNLLYSKLKPVYAEISEIENSIRPRKKNCIPRVRVLYDWGNEHLIMQMQKNMLALKEGLKLEFIPFEDKSSLLCLMTGQMEIILSTRNFEMTDGSLFSTTFNDHLCSVSHPDFDMDSCGKKIIISHMQKQNPVVMRAVHQLCSNQEAEGYIETGCSSLVHEMLLEGYGYSLVPSQYKKLPGWKSLRFESIRSEYTFSLRSTLYHSLTGATELILRKYVNNLN